MFDFKDKTVLITGASSGIGECFARALATRGARLILVARSRDKLQALAAMLGEGHRVEVLDLSQPDAAVALRARLKDVQVDVLVNNAGVGSYGPFAAHGLSKHSAEIALNVTTLVELTHLFMADIETAHGGVINVASTAAFQPVPYMAVYAATKAFVLSFSEALWAEYRSRGVRVLALCPGATDTAFFDVAGSQQAAVGPRLDPKDVVELALRAFAKNRPSVIHGARNFLMTWSSRFASRRMVAGMVEGIMRPRD